MYSSDNKPALWVLFPPPFALLYSSTIPSLTSVSKHPLIAATIELVIVKITTSTNNFTSTLNFTVNKLVLHVKHWKGDATLANNFSLEPKSGTLIRTLIQHGLLQLKICGDYFTPLRVELILHCS